MIKPFLILCLAMPLVAHMPDLQEPVRDLDQDEWTGAWGFRPLTGYRIFPHESHRTVPVAPTSRIQPRHVHRLTTVVESSHLANLPNATLNRCNAVITPRSSRRKHTMIFPIQLMMKWYPDPSR